MVSTFTRSILADANNVDTSLQLTVFFLGIIDKLLDNREEVVANDDNDCVLGIGLFITLLLHCVIGGEFDGEFDVVDCGDMELDKLDATIFLNISLGGDALFSEKAISPLSCKRNVCI